MRNSLILAGILVLGLAASSYAKNPMIETPGADEEWDSLLQYDLGSPFNAQQDTVSFGGSGLGNGAVIRGGIWDWEADSGATPIFFPDGDPVGNQYMDGWVAMDRTTRSGPSPSGAGHFDTSGNYDFDNDGGAYAHRASVHANDGVDDGPDPLNGSNWSVWIGTNLYLNPENCGWDQTAGHGDGWSQGIMKQYSVTAGTGAPVDITFYHRYAVEAGFDTAWVEVSFDGLFWEQVGTAENPNGIFNGGDKNGPLPGAAGGTETVQLTSWPGGTADLYVRFRFQSDAFFSDEGDGGLFFYVWQLDDISLLVNSVPQDFTDFESGYGGWQPMRFEGFDFDVTLDSNLAAGRIVSVDDLLCPIVLPCPEACGLEGNLLIFADKDDCNLGDSFQDSYLVSPPFSIGGPENPDIDGWEGRIVDFDVYLDGGAGLFETGPTICYIYSPFNSNACPYTPPAGDPGAGQTFNWSRTTTATCDFWSMGVGPACVQDFQDDVSANLPAEADSVVVFAGAFSQCRSEGTCDIQDNGAPFYDNMDFQVYNPEGVAINSPTLSRYSDNFPLAEQTHQGMSPLTSRSDGSASFPCQLGIEIPLRHVRADTAFVETGAQNAAMYLRWKVVPGPCQNVAHPFFTEYPPLEWHEARMDIGGSQGSGTPTPGTYMTCYHPSEANNGTSWGGEMTGVEPCDDILPDGVFSAGTQVFYFMELRSLVSGDVLGTSPTGANGARVDTAANYAALWREFETLPELVAPAQGGGCDPLDPNDRVNDILVISDTPSASANQRMKAFLDGFQLDYDYYDVVGTNFTCNYNGIGRREDRPTQQPRPPVGGATEAQLDPYSCVWYFADALDANTLDDQLTVSIFGGHPAIALQKLENWITGCSVTGEERLLVMDGYGWASDIDNNTTHGPAFLDNLGVDVIDFDYENLSGDLRRCARITGTAVAPNFDGEVWGTGCPEDLPADILAPINGGETVANYVDSQENGTDPVNCADDVNMPNWAAIIRKAAGTNNCRRSLLMGVSFARVFDLNCVDECGFFDWTVSGDAADMISDMTAWANRPFGSPIGVPNQESPALRTQLIGARPNPANPSARITYSLAHKGHVSLRIFDVSGRLVRTLIDGVVESSPEAYEVTWDGMNDAGQRVGSGVFFYQLDAPGYTSAKKLV
ncbi:MAG: hypothetical protein PVF43_14815, partial [Candidatus Eiseniibacteriota bacterium]